MGKTLDLEYFETTLKEAQDKCYKKAPELKASHRKGFVEACEVFQVGFEKARNAETEEELEKCAKSQQKAMKKCVKAADKIFAKLDMKESSSLAAAIVKGKIVMDATPQGLVDFCQKNEKNGKLIEHLLKEKDLMGQMLGNGGAKGGKYGEAMKIYTKILASFDDDEDKKITKINKKIALAVALELCEPITEFDTKVKVDALERYKHYAEAYKNGELDPAFPNLSPWEMRHVVNCDAKNDQLKWGRDMMMNYCPYVTQITDLKKKYTYILETDVLMRNPSWTSSPRTYQQVLSGGGKDGPNAWFGRFILKAFGIPTWGCKQPGRVAFTRWTPEGWEAVNGASWDECEWEDVSGIDFKGEVDGRSAHTEEEYFAQLVLLECLADVLDGRRGIIPEDEKTMIHPQRLWRSLSIIQKALMLEPASSESFRREGKGGVKTNVEKYLEIYEKDDPDDEFKNKNGKITVPAGANHTTYGNVMVIASFSGGKQVNFVGDGNVDFDLPDDMDGGTYAVTMDVCTVHLKQSPLYACFDHMEKHPIKIPYTEGEWKKTEPVEMDIEPGQTMSLIRERPCLGLAIKKIYLTPV